MYSRARSRSAAALGGVGTVSLTNFISDMKWCWVGKGLNLLAEI